MALALSLPSQFSHPGKHEANFNKRVRNKRALVGSELLHSCMWSPNSSTERDGSSGLLSRFDSLAA